MLRVKLLVNIENTVYRKLVGKLIYVYIDNHTKNVEGIKNSLPTFLCLISKSLPTKTGI